MIDDDDFGARSERPRKPHRKPKKTSWEVLDSLRASDDSQTSTERRFGSTVNVTNTERAWLWQHLGPFHRQKHIDDVLRRIKSGKEATVYLCSGHESAKHRLLAAKLYRARPTRGLQNVQQYQAGRTVLGDNGRSLNPRSWRLQKAIAQRSRKGQAALQTSWLMHEFSVLSALFAAGADVPEPIDHNEQALLLEFVGDGQQPAPTLNEVVLERCEAQPLFERVLSNVERLLALGWVHGDLSAYNILYQPGRIALIDFPQVASARDNPDARPLFERDLRRLEQYFARFGVEVDVPRLVQRLWARYVGAGESR
jgi:RIO kinase 1